MPVGPQPISTYCPAPSLFTIFVYYAILLALLTGWLFKDGWRAWKIAAHEPAAGGLVRMLRLYERSMTQLTVLPLSGGSAIYCDDAKNGDLLIDCGNDNAADFVMKPYLRAQGVNSPALARPHLWRSTAGGRL